MCLTFILFSGRIQTRSGNVKDWCVLLVREGVLGEIAVSFIQHGQFGPGWQTKGRTLGCRMTCISDLLAPFKSYFFCQFDSLFNPTLLQNNFFQFNPGNLKGRKKTIRKPDHMCS